MCRSWGRWRLGRCWRGVDDGQSPRAVVQGSFLSIGGSFAFTSRLIFLRPLRSHVVAPMPCALCSLTTKVRCVWLR